MSTEEIIELLDVRNILLEENYYSKAADQISDEIRNYLIIYFNDYPTEFILETLTHLGGAPNLVYDDNGKFAVADTCFATLATDEPKDVKMIITVEHDYWHKTIREAIKYYLNN